MRECFGPAKRETDDATLHKIARHFAGPSLADIVRTGAHPVYVVRNGRELLLPATPEVVRRVDIAGGVIVVTLPAGIEDL